MTGARFSLILLPTLACNADCDYCFENKPGGSLSPERLAMAVRKVADYMERGGMEDLSVYWQGGEVMVLPPEWFERANDIVEEIAQAAKIRVSHYLQSNMLAYSAKWNRVLSGMFGNSVGSSMDFPNLHRRLRGGSPEEYEKIWTRRIREAADAGVRVGVIAIGNRSTFDLGAERFYSYFADELGIVEFQVNTPFPGGTGNDVKRAFSQDMDRLSRFLLDLADVWLERGFQNGVKVGPFDRLMDWFLCENRNLLCTWRENCADDFLCIDPEGHVAQCDCWVASYPDFRYGNIFGPDDLSVLLEKSEARRKFRRRPGVLMQKEDCIECDYLHVCHGGCPVRTYTFHGDLFRKDPYCGLYKSLFGKMEARAAEHLAKRGRCAAARRSEAGSEEPARIQSC